MDADIVIAAVKVTSALLGGALGVIGLLFNFRGAKNRISRWGVVVLAGIVVSAGAGVLGSVVEGYKARSEANRQAARTARVLTDLSRAIQPITQLEIIYWAQLPSEAPLVRDYAAEVSRGIEARLEGLRRETFVRANDGGIHISASGLGGEPLTVEIGRRSVLWPRGKSADIGALVGSFTFNVFIRKTPIPEDTFENVISVDENYADWIATTFLPLRSDLAFDRRTGRLEIRGASEYKKSLWHSNGKITSIVDLYGAQIFLVLPTFGGPLFSERFKKYERPELAELVRLTDLKIVVLKFSEGRNMWIDGKAFKKGKSRFGNAMFSIVLPVDDEGLRRLSPRE